ncbi:MAG: transcription antitermination factor NusB [Bdellovibrionota bacterium]
MGKRRRAREAALQALYQLDLAGWEGPPANEILASVHEGESLSQAVSEYAMSLIEGVRRHRTEIDALLAAASHQWELHRMAAVDRNILRLSAYEILFGGEVPVPAAISEGVELAKRFGDKDSPAFINGILDRLARDKGQERPV